MMLTIDKKVRTVLIFITDYFYYLNLLVFGMKM
jgi:hypothetical protein